MALRTWPSGRNLFGEEYDADGKGYMDATVGTLPGSTSVAIGSAGVIEMVNGGPRFRLDDAFVAAPAGMIPGVAAEAGDAGDMIRVQVYGPAKATFRASLTTTSANRAIRFAAGAPSVGATASTVDNLIWGVATDSLAGRTHDVYLDGASVET